MVAIVEYGVGNLFSLASSFKAIGIQAEVTNQPHKLEQASHIVLPGVGAFGDAAQKLAQRGLGQVVCQQAEKGKPLLGICLGMQLLFDTSSEFGQHNGLGLIPGEIQPLKPALEQRGLGKRKVPHIGWNGLEIEKPDCPLLQKTRPNDFVYYVHSFYLPVGPYTAAYSEYGVAVSGVVQKGKVFGTQFHPEKSGDVGLAMLKAFTQV